MQSIYESVVADLDCYMSPQGEVYADVPNGDRVSSLPLRSECFNHWAIATAWERDGAIADTKALKRVVSDLEKAAKDSNKVKDVYLRVGKFNGKLYLDLNDDEGRVVEVDDRGWRIVTQCPISFYRPPTSETLPLPEPGGTLDRLRRLVNLEDADWQLMLDWLAECLLGSSPSYPILIVRGNTGAAKSWLAKIIKSLIDPSYAPLLYPSKDSRDLKVTAIHRWLIVWDHISFLSLSQSRTIAAIAEAEPARAQIIAGIDPRLGSDVLEHSISVRCPDIKKYIPESELVREFDRSRPSILGALLTHISSYRKP